MMNGANAKLLCPVRICTVRLFPKVAFECFLAFTGLYRSSVTTHPPRAADGGCSASMIRPICAPFNGEDRGSGGIRYELGLIDGRSGCFFPSYTFSRGNQGLTYSFWEGERTSSPRSIRSPLEDGNRWQIQL